LAQKEVVNTYVHILQALDGKLNEGPVSERVHRNTMFASEFANLGSNKRQIGRRENHLLQTHDFLEPNIIPQKTNVQCPPSPFSIKIGVRRSDPEWQKRRIHFFQTFS
jgi:hypothetical protein